MASNYTSNYQLCQWEGTDKVLRTDFNGDNAKIDAALAEKAEVVFGTYTGDGTATRTIDLGFTPKAVLLEHPSGMRMTNNNIAFGGLALLNFPANGFQIVEGGFSVRYNSGYVHTNNSGTVYHYLAFK